ncbi:MAG: polymerase delta subunit [Actinomycetota bacterium]
MAVHLLTGTDESLLLDGVSALVHRLLGSDDRSLAVDDFDGTEYTIEVLVGAAQTPPFLTDRRIVVGRGVGRFSTEDVAPLVAYLDAPMDTTDLVLVSTGGKLPKALSDALKRTGAHTVDTSPPRKDIPAWITQQCAAENLRLEQRATALVAAWMGEDAGRLQGVIDTLVSTYGTTRVLHVDDVSPFLGEAGGVPPWDLTDAIDRANATLALTLLHRMMGSGERHPLQVMSILHSHYAKMLRIDGTEARDEATVAQLAGVKPGFPARKVLEQYRRLGSSGVTRAISLLAQADLDLRGDKDLPESLVMEVLVARLSKLTGSTRR